MKKMTLLTLLLLLSVTLFTACEKDDDIRNPSQAMVNALAKLYPTASSVEWEKKGPYTVADCIVEGRFTDVWFSDDTSWVMTEIEQTVGEMTVEVKATLAASKYATWRIEEVAKLLYPEDRVEYVIEVEEGERREMNLYFDAEGALVYEQDVTTADDTHWPR